MHQLIYQVDAFTDRPFAGNPAGVCILEEERSENWMQNVALEMNLSETAFLRRREGGFQLRWFTPVREVELCGHATLAASHVLWQEKIVKSDQKIMYITLSGPLFARLDKPWIELDFPAEPARPAEDPGGLCQALDVSPVFIGRSRLDFLVEVKSELALREMKPDFRRLADVTSRGVIVTCRSSSSDYDFLSRFFAPAYGVDEDPVTGSSHCTLGPYWAEKLDKARLLGYQASARGGLVRVMPSGERVFLAGQAVTVIRGQLLDTGA
ncbi:MAG: PhzF family phenazine biosynthesis protein [Candidatus Glassbacteria bacterium]